MVLLYKGRRRELSGGFAHTTNNRMELLAAIEGLEALKEPCRVTLHSDSKYLVDAMSKGWIKGWKRNGWTRKKNQFLKNADLWKRLDAAVAGGHSIRWEWVKGHVGIAENERCDALAESAALAPDLPADRGYLAQEKQIKEEEEDTSLFG